ncbi:YitT family protein [Vagococcus intermedius]|uniref:YitT family protein n=1 Tax=Vagococcus intermedius TaxID=2991418 RepID=A0AAF0CUS7_9ENTE|nr:YitT family protein [Vagococcus intermedius]WEG73298.1 YitT family protein [Vagococcus intermedius]WEG75379.1 YitT family protein [Vagococcus intermedius]
MLKFFTKERLAELGYVMVGSFILAVSINSVLKPNEIVAGGANGISIILNKLFGIELAVTLYAINIPLLLLCFLLLGKKVGMKTIFGSLLYPFFVWVTASIPILTVNPLLASIFGGIITGIGLGIVFKGNASTGGTAILAQIVHKYAKFPLGLCVSVVDGFVILGALLAFEVDRVLYSLICLFVIGRVIDLVQMGFNRSKNVLIVSKEPEKVAQMILSEMDLGVTHIPVKGGYNQESKDMLMCVLPEKEFHKLNESVQTIDPEGFVVAMAASEVMGRGFSLGR